MTRKQWAKYLAAYDKRKQRAERKLGKLAKRQKGK